MRLQLTRDVAQELARRVGTSTSVEEDVGRILRAFKESGHDPFTRKDVTEVFLLLAGQGETREKVWKKLGDAIAARAESLAAQRGFYTQKAPEAQPQEPPKPHRSQPAPPPPVAKDERDNLTWVVFELTRAGEKLAQEGLLESFLRKTLKTPDHEIFVPYLSYRYDGRVSLFNVMEGYAFVASGLDERLYFKATVDSPYLKSVLSYRSLGSGVVLQTVPDIKIRELRDNLAKMVAVEIREGMRVEITRGTCLGLVGVVQSLTDEDAFVLIQMRTLRTIRTIPRFALFPLGDE